MIPAPQYSFNTEPLTKRGYCQFRFTDPSLPQHSFDWTGELNQPAKETLDQEFKTKWLEALRSGKYNQAKGALHVTSPVANGFDGYCCLGIACVILQVPSIGKNLNEDHNEYNEVFGNNDYNSHTEIPHLFAPKPLTKNYQDFFANLNDNGWTFEEIAQVIEKVL